MVSLRGTKHIMVFLVLISNPFLVASFIFSSVLRVKLILNFTKFKSPRKKKRPSAVSSRKRGFRPMKKFLLLLLLVPAFSGLAKTIDPVAPPTPPTPEEIKVVATFYCPSTQTTLCSRGAPIAPDSGFSYETTSFMKLLPEPSLLGCLLLFAVLTKRHRTN